MDTPDVTARLNYLDGAAKLLATSAPQTSRHLMFKHNTLVFDQKVDIIHTRRSKVCGGCGGLVLPGTNGKIERKKAVAKKFRGEPGVQKDLSETGRSHFKIYTCKICGKRTKTTVTLPVKKLRQKDPTISTTTPTPIAIPQAVERVIPPPNVPSEPRTVVTKRPKSLKKSGLSALLARQKASQSSSAAGFGLNLMDFMKKP